MQPPHSFLEINQITKTYNKTVILHEVSFNVNQHSNVAIVGISGSGKTSLLKIISGHLQANEGNIYFEGNKVIGPLEKLLPGHDGIAYLSQHFELHNNYVVKDLILFRHKLSSQKVDDLFTICQINHLLQRKTNELSGGEKQRIALCKLLITQPKLLILDEPFSNLDLLHTEILKNVLSNLQNELGISIIMASHNPLDTLNWATEIIVMQDGKIIQQGNPKTIFYYPKNAYVAGLFGKYNNLEKLLNLTEFSIARPNQIQLSNNVQSELVGTIKKCQFIGNYYQVEILVNTETCFVHTLTKPIFEVNDKVGLTINTNSLYF